MLRAQGSGLRAQGSELSTHLLYLSLFVSSSLRLFVPSSLSPPQTIKPASVSPVPGSGSGSGILPAALFAPGLSMQVHF